MAVFDAVEGSRVLARYRVNQSLFNKVIIKVQGSLMLDLTSSFML